MTSTSCPWQNVLPHLRLSHLALIATFCQRLSRPDYDDNDPEPQDLAEWPLTSVRRNFNEQLPSTPDSPRACRGCPRGRRRLIATGGRRARADRPGVASHPGRPPAGPENFAVGLSSSVDGVFAGSEQISQPDGELTQKDEEARIDHTELLFTPHMATVQTDEQAALDHYFANVVRRQPSACSGKVGKGQRAQLRGAGGQSRRRTRSLEAGKEGLTIQEHTHERAGWARKVAGAQAKVLKEEYRICDREARDSMRMLRRGLQKSPASNG